jgi:hypothetical protein
VASRQCTWRAAASAASNFKQTSWQHSLTLIARAFPCPDYPQLLIPQVSGNLQADQRPMRLPWESTSTTDGGAALSGDGSRSWGRRGPPGVGWPPVLVSAARRGGAHTRPPVPSSACLPCHTIALIAAYYAQV